MPFGGLKLTNFGLHMNAKAQAGKKLKLTRVAIGDGVLGSASIFTMSTLISEKCSYLISDIRPNSDTASAIFRMHNSELEQGFFYREIGIYARDPDTDSEGLYLYDNCRGEGEYIGDKNDTANRMNVIMRLHIKFAQTEQITFVPSPDPLYVLYEEFNTHVQDYNQHITTEERQAWNGKAAGNHNHDAAYAPLSHVNDTVKHISAAERIAWNGKAVTATYAATLRAAGWSGAAPYTQTVGVAGMAAADNPIADVVAANAAQLEAWGMVSRITTAAGSITAICYEDRPATDLNLQLKVVR